MTQVQPRIVLPTAPDPLPDLPQLSSDDIVQHTADGSLGNAPTSTMATTLQTEGLGNIQIQALPQGFDEDAFMRSGGDPNDLPAFNFNEDETKGDNGNAR